MLIDAHVHLFPDRLAEAIRRFFDQHFWDIRYRESAEACIARLRDGGVERAVALPYAHKPGMARALNDFTRDLARKHPLVAPCCTVFPGEDDAERIFDEALGSPDFVGAKMHCHVMRVAPDDPKLDHVWRASARHKKPVVIHAGPEPTSPGYGHDTAKVSGAARVRNVLERHPDAIVIIPHLGADEFVQFEALLPDFGNVYLDTTMMLSGFFSMVPDSEILRRHPTRILYGTDFPNIPYEWDRELNFIRGLKLPAADEALILGGNARRLFKLGPGAQTPANGE